ncbi:MAG: hypothetical protein WAN38_07600 [Terriglobales bacterium]
MNDIVSIRKIRPLPSADAETGGGDASLTGGGDFFFGGKQPSLAARESSPTSDL